MTRQTNALDELLNDSMVQLVMASDRVHPDEIRMLFTRAHHRSQASDAAVPEAHVIAKTCLSKWACCS